MWCKFWLSGCTEKRLQWLCDCVPHDRSAVSFSHAPSRCGSLPRIMCTSSNVACRLCHLTQAPLAPHPPLRSSATIEVPGRLPEIAPLACETRTGDASPSTVVVAAAPKLAPTVNTCSDDAAGAASTSASPRARSRWVLSFPWGRSSSDRKARVSPLIGAAASEVGDGTAPCAGDVAVLASCPAADARATCFACVAHAASPRLPIVPPTASLARAVHSLYTRHADCDPVRLYEQLRMASDLECRLLRLARTTDSRSASSFCSDSSDEEDASSVTSSPRRAYEEAEPMDALDRLAHSAAADAAAAAISAENETAQCTVSVLPGGGGEQMRMLPQHRPRLHELVLLLRAAALAYPAGPCSEHFSAPDVWKGTATWGAEPMTTRRSGFRIHVPVDTCQDAQTVSDADSTPYVTSPSSASTVDNTNSSVTFFCSL